MKVMFYQEWRVNMRRKNSYRYLLHISYVINGQQFHGRWLVNSHKRILTENDLAKFEEEILKDIRKREGYEKTYTTIIHSYTRTN
jgi:hypothetical protein